MLSDQSGTLQQYDVASAFIVGPQAAATLHTHIKLSVWSIHICVLSYLSLINMEEKERQRRSHASKGFRIFLSHLSGDDGY